MDKPRKESPQGRSYRKAPWERPRVRFAGTISLLVRGGSASGKAGGLIDGDAGQFQTCNPNVDPNCPPC
jgi:hypothetical protein